MAIRGSVAREPIPAPIPLIPAVKIDQTEPRMDGTSALAPEPSQPAETPVLEGIIEPEKLVIIEPTKRLEVFTLPGGLNPIIEAITAVARKHTPDLTTKKGREAIASNAYKVARCKTLLDDAGKEETAKAKEIPNAIDAARRDMRTRLEALQTEVRKPLTDWEAEQERIEQARIAAEAAVALAKAVESDHEIALLMDFAYTKQRQEEAEALERQVQEREEEIAREAAEKERQAAAQREADAAAALAKAEQDRKDAEQRQKDAEARAEQARKDAEAAKVKAEQESAELAERNRLAAIQAQQEADARAEQAAILARQQEQQRQEAARKKEADELAARERNAKHRLKVHTEAKEDFTLAGIAPEVATAVITAIRDGKIRHISISY